MCVFVDLMYTSRNQCELILVFSQILLLTHVEALFNAFMEIDCKSLHKWRAVCHNIMGSWRKEKESNITAIEIMMVQKEKLED